MTSYRPNGVFVTESGLVPTRASTFARICSSADCGLLTSVAAPDAGGASGAAVCAVAAPATSRSAPIRRFSITYPISRKLRSAQRLTNQRALEGSDLIDQRHAAIAHPPGDRVIDPKKPGQTVGRHAHESDRLGTPPGIASQDHRSASSSKSLAPRRHRKQFGHVREPEVQPLPGEWMHDVGGI